MHGVSGQRSLGPTTGWLASISTAELHLQGTLLLLPLVLQLQEESCEPRIERRGGRVCTDVIGGEERV